MSCPLCCRGPASWLAILVALSPLTFCACGDQRPPAHPVQGRVLFKNQPAEHALVLFHPDSTDERLAQLRPHGTVDAEGQFVLTTYEAGDGAPEGTYRVTITWPSSAPADSVEAEDPEYRPSGPDRLKGRYRNPSGTSLKVTIRSGLNALRPFELE